MIIPGFPPIPSIFLRLSGLAIKSLYNLAPRPTNGPIIAELLGYFSPRGHIFLMSRIAHFEGEWAYFEISCY